MKLSVINVVIISPRRFQVNSKVKFISRTFIIGREQSVMTRFVIRFNWIEL